MEQDDSEGGDKERVINFALLIRYTLSKNGAQFKMESQNQGIPDSEVILAVEAWLEKVKERHKNKITDGMQFGKKD